MLTNAQKTIWSNFHAVRISPELKHLWVSNFEHIVQKPLDGIFIHFVTQQVMEGLLKVVHRSIYIQCSVGKGSEQRWAKESK